MNLTSRSTTQGHWVSCPRPRSAPQLRLFFFPYAGAGSTTYHAWHQFFPPEIEPHLVHLPGRDQRINEMALTRFMPLVESIARELIPYLDMPFVFFGHSMGGLIGFEVARQLRRQYLLLPVHLFISGRQAPQLIDSRPKLHELPEPEFLKAVQDRYGVLPEIVVKDPALLELFLPILRADTALLENYRFEPEEPLECPISVMGGLQDHAITQPDLAAWRDQTENRFALRMFPGDHFFIQSSRAIIAQHVCEELDVFLRTLMVDYAR